MKDQIASLEKSVFREKLSIRFGRFGRFGRFKQTNEKKGKNKKVITCGVISYLFTAYLHAE